MSVTSYYSSSDYLIYNSGLYTLLWGFMIEARLSPGVWGPLTTSMWGSDGPGDLQLLQTETDTSSTKKLQNLSKSKHKESGVQVKLLTSSGVITPVSLNLDSCGYENTRRVTAAP